MLMCAVRESTQRRDRDIRMTDECQGGGCSDPALTTTCLVPSTFKDKAMNRKLLLAAVTLAMTVGTTLSLNAVAAEDNGPKTRAQVYAELEQARADGSFYSLGEGTPRRLTRARLAAQEDQARRARTEAAKTQPLDAPSVR